MLTLICAFSSLLTCIITGHGMWKHLKNYRRPDIQRSIIRIILMPLIYGVFSWFSYATKNAALILDPIRDCYEAFVIWVFFTLILILLVVTYLDGENSLMEKLDDGRLPVFHYFPLNIFLPPVDFSIHDNFLALKRGILQFVIIKPLLSLSIIILRSFDLYEEGIFDWSQGYPYIAFIYNLSVCLSLYYLVLFYMAVKFDLIDYDPGLKFICVKSVIFFSFWQSIIISILVQFGIIHDMDDETANSIAVAIQNFLICIEMVFASIAHHYAFSSKPFEEMKSARLPLLSAIKDVIGLNDLWLEARHTLKGTNFRSISAFWDATNVDEEHGMRNPLLSNNPGIDYGSSDDENQGSLLKSPRFIRVQNNVKFPDINPDEEIEKQYERARTMTGGDYGYRVMNN